jgi:DNA-binding transcriptional LysR family regulator
MDINTYKLFALVAKTKSISRTAKLTGYTQSSVSHTINRLEKEIGIELFIRDRYGVYLSPLGNKIFPKVLKLLSDNEQLEELVCDIKGLEIGTINIGTFASISIHWLPSILNLFREKHPHIHINLCEGGKDKLYECILNHQVDLAFYNGDKDDNIEFFPIKQDEFFALFPKNYPVDSTLAAYPISNFNGKPFILSESTIDPDIQQLLNENNLTPNIRLSSMDDYAIMSMVEHNLGLSILPELIVEQRKDYLKTLPLNPHYFRNLGIGLKSFNRSSPATKKFINFTLNYFNIKTASIGNGNTI